MFFFIRNFGIILCCIYYYIKLLNLELPKHFRSYSCIFSLILSLFSILGRIYFPYYTTPVLIIFIILFLSIQTKTTPSTCITTTTISFAISHIILIFASMLIGILFINRFNEETRVYAQVLSCLVQLLIMPLPFRIKRWRKGMPFLFNEAYAYPGMLISFFVLFTFIVLTYMSFNNLNSFLLIPFILICVFSLLIYHYWRSNLTKTYTDKLKDRNIQYLNQQISQQSNEIIRLKQENDRLAKIVHKDNKLIPTLEYSVRSFIENNSITSQDTLAEGAVIIERLSKLSGERKELVHQQDMTCQKITLTNVTSIDQYLNFFQNEANKNNIEFQTNIDCDMQYFIENVIEESNLETLLQDLLDDALHATKANNGHYILLSIGIVSNIYTISFFDSGVPFTTDVLLKWGLEQITTRKDVGGSGIGMISTYDTLQKYNASFMIHELGTDNHTFTKEVTIAFDKRKQYILQTNRSEEELAILSKRVDLQIIRQ